MLLSYAIVGFYLFYDVANMSLLTFSQCRVLNTQLTVKVGGPLVQKKDQALFEGEILTKE